MLFFAQMKTEKERKIADGRGGGEGVGEARSSDGEKVWWSSILTIYAPMIYTAPCIMFWMHAYPLQGQVGGGWALEF